MKKLDMKTNDLTKENIDKIAELFPGIVTEVENENGEVIKKIDTDLFWIKMHERFPSTINLYGGLGTNFNDLVRIRDECQDYVALEYSYIKVFNFLIFKTAGSFVGQSLHEVDGVRIDMITMSLPGNLLLNFYFDVTNNIN